MWEEPLLFASQTFSDNRKRKPDEKPIVYYHNLKYDFSVLKNLYIYDICIKDGNIYSVKVIFNNRIIELRDSYKMINVGLNKFNSMLGLDKDLDKKEAFGYSFYNYEHLNNPMVSIEDYKKCLKPSEFEQFIVNLNENKELFEFEGDMLIV